MNQAVAPAPHTPLLLQHMRRYESAKSRTTAPVTFNPTYGGKAKLAKIIAVNRQMSRLKAECERCSVLTDKTELRLCHGWNVCPVCAKGMMP